jgi:hypothetical protein
MTVSGLNVSGEPARLFGVLADTASYIFGTPPAGPEDMGFRAGL